MSMYDHPYIGMSVVWAGDHYGRVLLLAATLALGLFLKRARRMR